MRGSPDARPDDYRRLYPREQVADRCSKSKVLPSLFMSLCQSFFRKFVANRSLLLDKSTFQEHNIPRSHRKSALQSYAEGGRIRFVHMYCLDCIIKTNDSRLRVCVSFTAIELLSHLEHTGHSDR